MPAHLRVESLSVRFASASRTVFAVNGVSFEVARGERVGIAGESGSGKSVTCAAVLSLLPAHASVDGSVEFLGDDEQRVLLSEADERLLNQVRGRRIGYVFQDSRASLDPYSRIGPQMMEVVTAHGASAADAERRTREWLRRVGIPDPDERFDAYPHELSGGMCQRVGIALALITEPEMIIADEPTSDVDVTTQERLLDLLDELCRTHAVTLLIVSHDLGVLSRLCSRVLVFYGGLIVEAGPINEVIESPIHPYSRGLMGSVPRVSEADPMRSGIPGHATAVEQPLTGCPFSERCDQREERCDAAVPELRPLEDPARQLRCPVAQEALE